MNRDAAIRSALRLANSKIGRRRFDDGGEAAAPEESAESSDTSAAADTSAANSGGDDTPAVTSSAPEAPSAADTSASDIAPVEEKAAIPDMPDWQREYNDNLINSTYEQQVGRAPTADEYNSAMFKLSGTGGDASERIAVVDDITKSLSSEAHAHAMDIAQQALNQAYYGSANPGQQGIDFWNKWAKAEGKAGVNPFTKEDVERLAARRPSSVALADYDIYHGFAPGFAAWQDARQDWIRPDASMQHMTHTPEAMALWNEVNKDSVEQAPIQQTQPQRQIPQIQQPQYQPPVQQYQPYYGPLGWGNTNQSVQWLMDRLRGVNNPQANYFYQQPFDMLNMVNTQSQQPGFGSPNTQPSWTGSPQTRKDGGAVWDKPRPKDLGKPDPLSKSQKKSAKASAKAAGRPYPNLVDNMRAAQRKK